jgi:hypothetical protein
MFLKISLGISHSKKSSEESLLKRKHSDDASSTNDHKVRGNGILYDESIKRPKSNNLLHQNSLIVTIKDE